ncbi:hypothetical protein ACF09Y_01715 [Streptomyces massasporeus]|uniref:hypothetical protein n=1 Tax=Streptomyces massasporeus TaxID=67324 RepID=UPI0036F80F44
MTSHAGPQPDQPSALDIAAQWAQMPAEHLTAALKALEPQLKREHQLRTLQENNRARLEEERLKTEHEREKRRHRRHMVNVSAGLAVALGGLAGSLYFGTIGQLVLAVVLFGPNLVVLVKMFTLRRSDPQDIFRVTTAMRTASLALPPPDPAPGTPPGSGPGAAAP